MFNESKDKFLVAVIFSLATSGVFALTEPFGTLKCAGVFDDGVKISVRNETLTLKWKAVKRISPHPLVSSVASPEIPKHLLAAYETVDTEIKFPLADCGFTDTEKGLFKCEGDGPVSFKSNARLSNGQTDTYEGTLSSYTLKSVTSEKIETHFYSLSLGGEVNGVNISTETSEYIAAPHSSEGHSFSSECFVDGEALDLRN